LKERPSPWCVGLAVLLLVDSRLALAADEAPAACCEVDTAKGPEAPDLASAGFAVVPGLLVHGAGHWLAGDDETAKLLLVAAGLGHGGLLLGGGRLALSGASRHFVGPTAALSVAGAGLFVTSCLADIYGVTVPRGGPGARPELRDITVAAGALQVSQPHFA